MNATIQTFDRSEVSILAFGYAIVKVCMCVCANKLENRKQLTKFNWLSNIRIGYCPSCLSSPLVHVQCTNVQYSAFSYTALCIFEWKQETYLGLQIQRLMNLPNGFAKCFSGNEKKTPKSQVKLN